MLTAIVVLYKYLSGYKIDWGHLLKSIIFYPEIENNVYRDPVVVLGWTLGFEVFFYMIAAASMLWSKRLRNVFIPTCVMFAVLLGWIYGFYYGASIIIEFLFGFLIAIIDEGFGQRNIPRLIARYLMVCSIVLVLIVSTGVESRANLGNSGFIVERLVISWGCLQLPRWFVWGGPCSILFLSFLLNENKFVWRFSLFGEFTYPFYLSQYLAIWMGRHLGSRFGVNDFISTIVIVLISVLLSYSVRVWLDKPIVKIGNKLANKKLKQTISA